MRAKSVIFGWLILLTGFFVQSFGWQDEENVRGAFLTTRPKQDNSSNYASRKPASRPARRPARKPTTTTNGSPHTNTNTNANKSAAEKTAVSKLGLGLTLFMRDSNGLAVRVDPSHEFRKGDRIRLLLETNADGYFYIFNTTDGGQPVMIYPDPDLDEAGNFLQAHVPFETPSSVAADERRRWLRFDEHAGKERLYFVFSREPLPQVPIEDELVSFCHDSKNSCPWRPSSEVWAQVQKSLSTPVKTNKAERFGRAQTTSEHEATTRGIGLSKEDPEPSLIMMTASSNTGLLATTLDLIHK
jgi:hypothetical protein